MNLNEGETEGKTQPLSQSILTTEEKQNESTSRRINLNKSLPIKMDEKDTARELIEFFKIKQKKTHKM